MFSFRRHFSFDFKLCRDLYLYQFKENQKLVTFINYFVNLEAKCREIKFAKIKLIWLSQGNPKLHKDHKPYRAIVNNIGTPTEKMAEIAEKELNEYVESTPSYLKDTTDFLCKLKEVNEPLPKDSILFCFDVVKLYPSIPREEGMQACQNAFETRTDKTVGTEEVMAMIKTVLENNVFEFDGKEYIQTEGVAIGSKLGRNLDCAYMRQWDEMLVQCEKQPMFYKRFIDDGFGIRTHGVEELVKFQTWANGIHPNIQVELR